MPKLTKQEYLIKAAKLYGLSEVEIEGLENHLNGTMPNDYIMRRCDSLVRLYKIYDSKKYNERGTKIKMWKRIEMETVEKEYLIQECLAGQMQCRGRPCHHAHQDQPVSWRKRFSAL